MIAAGHGMVIDRADITRNSYRGIERQALILLGQRSGFFRQNFGLAQGGPAAGLLALLHRHAAQGGPGLKHRVLRERPAHVMAVLRRLAARLQPRLHALFPGGFHERHDPGGQVAVHLRQKIQPRDFVMRGLRKHGVAADGPVVRRTFG